MGQKTFANARGVAHKSSSSMSIAFPDVCKTPVPIVGVVPIPYPNFAKTATAAQKTKSMTKTPVMTKGSQYSQSAGDAAGTVKGMVSSKVNRGMVSTPVKAEGKKVAHFMGIQGGSARSEIQQLKGMLNGLHNKLQALKTNDPNEWQTVLQEYAVAASALYMTQNDG